VYFYGTEQMFVLTLTIICLLCPDGHIYMSVCHYLDIYMVPL